MGDTQPVLNTYACIAYDLTILSTLYEMYCRDTVKCISFFFAV